MQDFIKATKVVNGKTITKKFSTESWNLLTNKNGWVALDEPVQIVKSAKIVLPPDNGTPKNQAVKKQIVKNTAPVASSEQTVVDETKEKVSEPVGEKSDTVEGAELAPAKTGASEEFAKIVSDNLTKSMIKDYFDSLLEKENPVDVKYSNTANLQTLTDILADHLKNDTELLKTEFKISEL